MTSPLETEAAAVEARAGRELVALDWLVTQSANRLHYAELTDQQAILMFEDRHLTTPVKLACGRTVDDVSIPGILTRTSAQRCRGCCRRLHYPPGKGSPKNSPACRRILGLENT